MSYGDRPGPTHDLREFVSRVYDQLSEVLKRLATIERKIKKMPTREEFNAKMQELKDAIAAEAAQVTAEIQALRDALAAGTPITDQDLADLQSRIDEVKNVDPDATP